MILTCLVEWTNVPPINRLPNGLLVAAKSEHGKKVKYIELNKKGLMDGQTDRQMNGVAAKRSRI